MARRRNAVPVEASRLIPPEGGAVVRMYRIGHGDCFLIAFAGTDTKKPTYVWIDCGYKPGSQAKLPEPTTASEVAASIVASTGGFIDVAVITHEHQDHVNAITEMNFRDLKVGTVWFAWTENPQDELANRLRQKYRDQLLGLIDAGSRLRAASARPGAADATSGAASSLAYVEEMLEFELGEAAAGFAGAAGLAATGSGKDPKDSFNKKAMKQLRDLAGGKVEFLYPHGKPLPLPGAASARVFVLGPPWNQAQIEALDPVGEEEFHLAARRPGHGFMAAASALDGTPDSPFPRRFVVALDELDTYPELADFLGRRYHSPADSPEPKDLEGTADNAAFRRIDEDWLLSAGQLALAMNNATNNASLVLAFELSPGGDVLLFAADAQAGSWRSWNGATWKDGDRDVDAFDLLGRTVLYKVGHHGSHNATLDGRLDSPHANLSWMGRENRAPRFAAMITAVRQWAMTKKDGAWNHPLPAIKDALLRKAAGRVLQTDTDIAAMKLDPGDPEAAEFLARLSGGPLYFDLKFAP